MPTPTFQPLNDRILVRRIAVDDTTSAGIIIPDGAKEKPTKGHVIAVGTGELYSNGLVRTLGVVPGDVVMFGRKAGQEVVLDGETFVVMREVEVMGVVS